MTTPLDRFAAGLVRLSGAPLPDDVAHETRRCFLNVLGTALGARATREIDAVFATGHELGGAEISVLGRPEHLDRFFAATALGFAAHFDDFDDTHLETVIHPGAATMGALYSVGLALGVEPDAALSAMALGVEAQLRVGLAMSPSHYDLGWHITGTCGVVGAAVASGISLGLDAIRLTNAIAIAMTMTIGQRESFGTPVKPYHAGKAASNGLLAAMLARSGVVADSQIATHDRGYFATLSEVWSTEWIEADDLGRTWVILDNTYKPFPCGIVAHPAIEAATRLHGRVAEMGFSDVESVSVWCNPLVAELMGRRVATTGLEARFCAIHGVAVGLLTGAGGLAQFSDAMSVDPEVVGLREHTVLEPDGRCAREAAAVNVTFRDGSVLRELVETASGSRARPLSDSQLQEKFKTLVEPELPGRSEMIVKIAMELGNGVTIADVDRVVRGE